MADMEPVQYLTTPAFSSNDPATDGLKMIPVDDNPAEHTEKETKAVGKAAEKAERKAEKDEKDD